MEAQFAACAIKHFLFIRSFGHKAVDMHLLGLPNSMGTCLSLTKSSFSCPSLYLNIILWIPVTIKDNHSISRSQIQSQTTSSCGQQEDEIRTIIVTEAGKVFISIHMRCLTIETQIFIFTKSIQA